MVDYILLLGKYQAIVDHGNKKFAHIMMGFLDYMERNHQSHSSRKYKEFMDSQQEFQLVFRWID